MARQIEAWVAENYANIKADEGLTWEQLATRFDVQDPFLAAWMREQPEEGDLETTLKAPRATRRPRQQRAAGSQADADAAAKAAADAAEAARLQAEADAAKAQAEAEAEAEATAAAAAAGGTPPVQ